MRVAKRTQLCVTIMLVVGAAALILGCGGARKQASSVPETPPNGSTQQATGKAPPIPEAGPLARPKSGQQVGAPAAATRTAIPPDNPQAPEKIALGQKLFFDGRLSADGTVACSTCHDPARAFNGPDLLRAIASYERTQLSFDSPFDHFIAGDTSAIDDAAKRGWELFNSRGGCNKCHALTVDKRDVTNFTDNDFHNIGIGIIRHNVVALARQAEQLINSGDTAAIDRAAIQTDMSALGRLWTTTTRVTACKIRISTKTSSHSR